MKKRVPERGSDRMDFLQGTLEMLILRTLVFGRRHGYGIAQSIRQTSHEAFLVEAGSLYPALQRLELQKLITAKWDTSETGRRARFYTLTPAGRRKLSATMSRWDDFVSAVARVLNPHGSSEQEG
jgi:PadR family transcriptional regulator PadR